MKILQCSDLHGDAVTSGVYRFEEARSALHQAVGVAIAEKVDLFVFTGDLSDPDDGPRALRALGLAIDAAATLLDPVADRRPIPSWWIAGNHDVFEDGSGESVLTPLDRVDPRVRVFDRPARAMLPCRPRVSRGAPAHAIVLPYPSHANAYDPGAFVADARRALGPGSQVVVMTHLQVEGATPGDETTEMARGRDVFFPFEACDPEWLLVGGHYHEAQAFERAGRRLHVPGSMMRLTHGEERNRPRFLVWEV
jgi:DNA repair exonuclease SbcCD nuclease subunit